MPHRQRAVRLNVPNPLALALTLAFASAAHAEDPSPYYIGVSQAFTHDSNIFRSSVPRADTISSTGVLGGIDQTLSRQRVYANLSAQVNRHQEFEQLNNTSFNAAAGLDWQTLERLRGTLRYSAVQNLVNYADVNNRITNISTRDVQKVQQALASIHYGINSQFSLEGSAERRTVDFSAPEDKRGFTQRAGSLGVRWGGTGIVTLGVGARLTKTETPQAVISPFILGDPLAVPPIPDILATYGPDKSDRKDIDITSTWTPSALSTVVGRISLTRETHTQPTIPKFSGVTGAVSWDYKPTGRTSFKASLTRDTSSETTFSGLPLNLIPVRADNNRLNTVALLQVDYEATAKILLNASLKHGSGSVSSEEGSNGTSTTNVYGIGARYAPTRTLSFACDINKESRTRAYDATVASCSAQFVLR